jgi:hypothetical protein
MSYKSIIWFIVSLLWFPLFFGGKATKAYANSTEPKKVLSSHSSGAETVREETISQPPEKIVEQVTSTFGSPSLHRAPREGESEFEPTRIPLRLPAQKFYRSSPSITIINPSGYGASSGSVGIGLGLQERTRFRDESDGVIGLGFGLGNPQKNLGLQVGITLVDISDPFRDGTVNLKLHRRLPYDLSVALGVQGAVTWGDPDGGSSVYGVATKRIPLKENRSEPFSEIYTSLGVGGGQFRSEFNIDNELESVGVFGSVAVRVIEPINLIGEWTGQDLTFGVSIVPFRTLPLVIVPGITDVTGQAGDGARLILGVGYSLSF